MDAKSIQAAAIGGLVGGAAVYCCVKTLPGLRARLYRCDSGSSACGEARSQDCERAGDRSVTELEERGLLKTLTEYDPSCVWWLPVIVRECLSGERVPQYEAPQLSAVADVSQFGGATRAKSFLLESGVRGRQMGRWSSVSIA